MKTLTAIAALLATFAAQATEPPPKPSAVAAAASTALQKTEVNTKVAVKIKTAPQAAPAAAPAAPAAAAPLVVREEHRERASTAYAAPVMGTNGTCLGGVSGGVQGAVGVSFSSTTLDDGCDTRYDAGSLAAQGYKLAAIARLCQRPANAKAMADAGTPCPGSEKRASEAPAVAVARREIEAP